MADIYVAEDGGPGGVGSEADPYDLQSALDNVVAGNTIWVKWGDKDEATKTIYTAASTGWGNGGAGLDVDGTFGVISTNSPIIIEAYAVTTGDMRPGETYDGSYTTFDFENTDDDFVTVAAGRHHLVWRYLDIDGIKGGRYAFKAMAAGINPLGWVWDTCKMTLASGVDYIYAIRGKFADSVVENCIITGARVRFNDSDTGGNYISNSLIDMIGIDQTVFFPAKGDSIYNTIIIDGARAIQPSEGGVSVVNCTCYNQTDACISMNNRVATAYVQNNILMPAVGATDYAIEIHAGNVGAVVYCDNNCVWAVDGELTVANGFYDTQKSAAIPVGNNNLSVDPMFADAANNDFRLLPSSPLWNKGKPTLTGGYTTPGSWNRINLPLREE